MLSGTLPSGNLWRVREGSYDTLAVYAFTGRAESVYH
jgi:hypothetical protein